MISVASLVAAGIGPTQARVFEKFLVQTCDQFDIDTPEREAAFVAQAAHESTLFTHLEENLFYRDPARLVSIFRSAFRADVDALAVSLRAEDATLPIAEAQSRAAATVGAPYACAPEKLANRAYALRNGNGDEQTGDGFRFRGRGLFQLTGKANYRMAADELREPFLEHPEYVADPADACLTAGWYWNRYRLNVMADKGDIDGITRSINGAAMAGAQARRDLYARALAAFA